MSEEGNFIVGPYRLEATNDVMLASRGGDFIINAYGELSNIQINSTVSTALATGNALVSLSSMEGVEGSVSIVVSELGTITHYVGPPEIGALIQMEPELITISVGPPGVGASITMTPESITFKVAEVMMSITPEGITEVVAEVTREVTPQGHNLTAAETEFNVGVQGEVAEGPTKMEEVEGGTVENETLGSDTTDALKNEAAGIEITE